MFCPKIDYLIVKILKIYDVYNYPRFDIPDNYVDHVMEILLKIYILMGKRKIKIEKRKKRKKLKLKIIIYKKMKKKDKNF